MNQPRKSAVAILSHGRANNVRTYHVLRQQQYTGPIYIIIDDEDDDADEYRKIYGDQVIQFDKKAAAEATDQMDNFDKRNAVLYARNACQWLLRDRGYTHVLQLDDDYQWFGWRAVQRAGLRGYTITNLDEIFNLFWDFLDNTPARTIAMAQGGDYIGGWRTKPYWDTYHRKAMNSFFTRTDRPVRFVGRINEDVNTYVSEGNRGEVFLTHTRPYLVQGATQQNAGGLTEMYLEEGTYVKSFYSVMIQPSSVKAAVLDGGAAARIHHRIDWNKTVPKILSPSLRNPHTTERKDHTK